MSSPSFIVVGDENHTSSPGPRAGGPTSRRSFTPAQKLAHLAAHDSAIKNNDDGAYLRTEGLYSSQITERQQAKIARLRRQLSKTEQRLKTTGVALEMWHVDQVGGKRDEHHCEERHQEGTPPEPRGPTA